MNKAILMGRLTKDPDIRYTQGGTAVASFTLAVNRRFANQNGERETDFINIVAWNKTAEFVANYFKKGQQVGIIGRIQTRNYENNEGKKVYITEVIAEEAYFAGAKTNDNKNTDDLGDMVNEIDAPDISDDDLPF